MANASEALRERSRRHQRHIPIFRKNGSVVEGSAAFVRDRDSEKVMDSLVLIADVVEAAEKAERKLWREYRRKSHDFDPGDALPEHESWAEGERLAAVLVALQKHLESS